MWRKYYLVVFVKLFLIFLLPVLTYFSGKIGLRGCFCFSTEIFFVMLCSSFIALKSKLIASVISCLAIFCLQSQLVVLFFSNSFINLNMIDNISSLRIVAGAKHVFLISIVILSSCIPPYFINLAFYRKYRILSYFCSFCFLACLGLAIGTDAYKYSGTYQYLKLVNDYIRLNELRVAASKLIDINKESFWKPYVADGIDKPHDLPDRPNIILIFTEGLSENIVSDSRMIMPNLSNFRERCLEFTNYYNHTFATYMGIIGTLFSGYQQNNFDVNNLVSLQGILGNHGYKTVFLNVEPYNIEFTSWVGKLGFDETLTNVNKVDGMGQGMSDRSAYEFLYEVSKKHHSDNRPFFICIYTFGTHAAFDGIYKKFGDGKNPLLNRFHENDYWFGEFLRRFNDSNMVDDTMIVFTSDHATYADGDFQEAFPDYVRSVNNLDKIPLFFYFNGMEPMIIDVQGRNSLNLAPSILDYLDFTEENFFLGETLFKSSNNLYSTIFQSLTSYYNTKNSIIVPYEDKLFEKDLMAYFSLKGRSDSLWKDIQSPYAVAERNMINGCVEVKIQNVENCDMLRLAIWSESDGQDDIQWIECPFENNIIIDSTKFKEMGVYNVHIFRVEDEVESFATWTTLFIDFEDIKQ